jgi:hypothetical protein
MAEPWRGRSYHKGGGASEQSTKEEVLEKTLIWTKTLSRKRRGIDLVVDSCRWAGRNNGESPEEGVQYAAFEADIDSSSVECGCLLFFSAS